MEDLTVVYLTVNKLPTKWVDYQLSVLKEAVGKYPVISVSRVPMDFGLNIIQVGDVSVVNIYRQMLKAFKLATTDYVAIAEDDCLYPYDHFHSFRPSLDTFAYNYVRWQNNVWHPTYYWRCRISNFALIAPRLLAIESLEERFHKCSDDILNTKGGELGRKNIEKRLHVTVRNSITFGTTTAIVCVHHDYGLDPLEVNHKKKIANLRADSIPYWGDCKNIVKYFI